MELLEVMQFRAEVMVKDNLQSRFSCLTCKTQPETAL